MVSDGAVALSLMDLTKTPWVRSESGPQSEVPEGCFFVHLWPQFGRQDDDTAGDFWPRGCLDSGTIHTWPRDARTAPIRGCGIDEVSGAFLPSIPT